VYAYDLNRNSRDEIYWITDARGVSSVILERPTQPSDVSREIPESRKTILRVVPSPCRSDAAIFLDRVVVPQAAAWSAYDASGRLVLRHDLESHAGQWILPARHLRPGLYFLRVTDLLGRSLATGRVTVVR
jgi:hypothetical protein